MEGGGYNQASNYTPPSVPSNGTRARVDPRYPLPMHMTDSPNPQQPPFLNTGSSIGTALENDGNGNKSRRRKPAGPGFPNNLDQSSRPIAPPPPPAPDPPQPLQVSYRGPYDDGMRLSTNNTGSRSSAARARTIPDNVDSELANSAASHTMPVVSSSRHSRRASLKQPPGSIYHQIQRSAVPLLSNSSNDPSSPQPFASATSPRQRRTSIRESASPSTSAAKSPHNLDGDTSSAHSNTQRTPAGAMESPSDWAADRSPLQKLEVKLNDISKEEKRARVEEAERKLRESKAARADRKTNDEPRLSPARGPSRHISVINGDNRSMGSRTRDQQHTKNSPQFLGEDLSNQHAMREPNGDKKEEVIEQRRNASGPAAYHRFVAEAAQAVPNRAVSNGQSQHNRRRSVAATDVQRSNGQGVRFQNNEDIGAPHGVKEPDRSGSGDGTEEPDSGFSNTAQFGHSPSAEHRSRHTINQNNKSPRNVSTQQQQLFVNRVETSHGDNSTAASPDPLPGDVVRTRGHGVKYEIPPQTASGIDARQKIGFGSISDANVNANVPDRKHRFTDIFHRNHHQETDEPLAQSTQPPRHLDEWRRGGVARLTLADMAADVESTKDNKAWWEGKPNGEPLTIDGVDGVYDDSSGKSSYYIWFCNEHYLSNERPVLALKPFA